ncbi:MAG: oligoendopeptidase F [Lachnospiraceae bacterium]|nr:oligoendopeptidase F [Lachnospiraceae bacterium]
MSIPKRSEVPVEFTWDLSPIFENDAAWEDGLKALGQYPGKIAAFQGHLGDNAATLLSFLKLSDEIELLGGRVYGYASLSADVDLADARHQAMLGKARSCLIGLYRAAAFQSPEIMAIPQEKLDAFLAEEPALKEYGRSLYQIRRKAAHILSPECETLLAGAQEIAGAPDRIGSTLRNTELHFPDATDSEGRAHTLTGGTLVPLLESADRGLRKDAYEKYYDRMGEYKNTIAATLEGQFKKLCFFANARHYSGTLEASLDNTEVPEAVYHNLIEAVHGNLDKMYRYVSLRKRLLGVDELHMYDVYRPIIEGSDKKILFDEAKANVLDAMKVLGEDYVALLNRAFSERWIDIYENEGKRGGAYSSGGARPHPYILLNHHDNLDSQFTLVHELGHSMHSWFSKENQPVSTADYVIFVAEVASTCNEVLLMHYLLEHTTDKKERAALINHFLDQFKGTIYRQTMFAEFELMMGRMAEQGETLTAEALCEKYKALNALYFGPEMVTDDRIALEWTRIPHFFYNYYVFQYATGFSAAVAIAKRILKEGAPAVADYKRFLSGGSSQDPVSLLKIAGVDMSSPEPVNEALAYFGELLDEIETLV